MLQAKLLYSFKDFLSNATQIDANNAASIVTLATCLVGGVMLYVFVGLHMGHALCIVGVPHGRSMLS